MQIGSKAVFAIKQEDGSWKEFDDGEVAELPYYSESNAKFQAFLSEYTINSFLWAAVEKEGEQ